MKTGILDVFSQNVDELEAERDVDGLIEALKRKDIVVRTRAAKALGEIGDARAVESLIQTLKDEPRYVRGEAARALGQIGDKKAVEPLIQALKDKGALNRHVRERAARALGQIGDEKAVEPLIQALRLDEWLTVREGAIEALGKMGEPAQKRLIRGLRHKSRGVRLTAAWALGYMGDEQAARPLADAQKDGDSSVRKAARVALGKIRQRKRLRPLRSIEGWR